MLFNTVKNRNYTVNYRGYVLVTSADGTVTQKDYDEVTTSHKVQISTSFIGELIILSNTKFSKDGLLEGLFDRNGEEVYDNGIWQIASTVPVVNALGIVEGYKYKAKMISGEING
jgi:hypothetical protein